MKVFVMTVIIIASMAFVASVIWYGINKSKYDELLNRFQNNHALPAPYSFSSMVGFFGAPLMAYFFLRLQKNKSILFVEKHSDAYNFPDNDNTRLMTWLSVFIGLLMTSLGGYLLLFIIAVLLNA